MSPNHPNRSRASRPGRNPKPAEIARLREEMELTQAQAGEILYVSGKTWQQWELGERRMHPALWEFFNLLWAFREVEVAREVWLTSGDAFAVKRAANERQQSNQG